MIKRLILAGLGAAVILAGVATFSAFTAQWVNITARVEKEIEVACVDTEGGNSVACDYGVVFPQNSHEKIIEVALSKSFYKQRIKSDVKYWVLWECKPVDETKPPGPGNPCREDVVHTDTDLVKDAAGNWVHDPLKPALDGNIGDWINVTASAGCLGPYTGPVGGVGKLKGIGNGQVDDTVVKKCYYHLEFTPPVCKGHVNPLTDPTLTPPKEIKCHEKVDPNPQLTERFAELGANFKIQVYKFSLH